jgi:hypothetical protein
MREGGHAGGWAPAAREGTGQLEDQPGIGGADLRHASHDDHEDHLMDIAAVIGRFRQGRLGRRPMATGQ